MGSITTDSEIHDQAFNVNSMDLQFLCLSAPPMSLFSPKLGKSYSPVYPRPVEDDLLLPLPGSSDCEAMLQLLL